MPIPFILSRAGNASYSRIIGRAILPNQNLFSFALISAFHLRYFDYPQLAHWCKHFVFYGYLGKALTGQTPATLPEVYNIAATGYGLKFFLSACMTPLLYGIKNVMTNQFGLVPLPADPEGVEKVEE